MKLYKILYNIGIISAGICQGLLLANINTLKQYILWAGLLVGVCLIITAYSLRD